MKHRGRTRFSKLMDIVFMQCLCVGYDLFFSTCMDKDSKVIKI